MSNPNAKPRVYAPGNERTYLNAQATTVGPTAAMVAANAGIGVLYDSANDDAFVLPTANGGVASSLGVLVDSVPASGYGRVQTSGIAVMLCDGGCTRGQPAQISDTTGKLGYAKTKGGTAEQIGVFEETALDGDPVRVNLRPVIHSP